MLSSGHIVEDRCMRLRQMVPKKDTPENIIGISGNIIVDYRFMVYRGLVYQIFIMHQKFYRRMGERLIRANTVV
jgi:hypothetical protein